MVLYGFKGPYKDRYYIPEWKYMDKNSVGDSNNQIMYVLDYGFVRLVESMGNDLSVVQAARVSFDSGSKGEEADRKLIRYLIKNKHTSPFEMVEFKFHIKCPIFVARQWMRHRTWNYNEVSGRYVELPEEYYLPEPEHLAYQSESNKQGRGTNLHESDSIKTRVILRSMYRTIASHYQELLDLGLAKELARLILPVATYTQFYGKVDLHNLLHFLELRLHSHAQWEIQQYAQAILTLIEPVVPWCIEDFREYRMKS